jgi:glycosyltransferase involved in cell wall biosynthesis
MVDLQKTGHLNLSPAVPVKVGSGMQEHATRKKILVVASYQYIPYFSGGQKSIAQFLDYLGGESDLTVISVAANDTSLIKSYRHLPWLKRRSSSRYTDLSLPSKITGLLRSENFDNIIWEHPYYTWLAKWIRSRTGIRTMLHIHNIEFQRFRSTGKWWWPILKIYERAFFRLADLDLFVSPDDLAFAVNEWGIPSSRCLELAFGVEISGHPQDRDTCKEILRQKHAITPGEKILLFNGLLDYQPNVDALRIILEDVNPLLLQAGLRYRIIICGKGLPAEWNGLESYAGSNITYAGFVDDITIYFKGSDLFLNTVLTGGGVKTKLVESIAFGTTVITTTSGALGVRKEVCGEKLRIVADGDWKGFAQAVINAPAQNAITPASYYEHYFWGNIVKTLLQHC